MSASRRSARRRCSSAIRDSGQITPWQSIETMGRPRTIMRLVRSWRASPSGRRSGRAEANPSTFRSTPAPTLC
uniref:Uncharacterized protein n=1 Tax=Zea mays TaxID=4577 RepID=C4J4U4_MAIZE|nr:unknown [Zea mays]